MFCQPAKGGACREVSRKEPLTCPLVMYRFMWHDWHRWMYSLTAGFTFVVKQKKAAEVFETVISLQHQHPILDIGATGSDVFILPPFMLCNLAGTFNQVPIKCHPNLVFTANPPC